MKEIRRRAKSNVDEGIACGPVFVYANDAEIVLEDEGKEVFLHAQYVSEAPGVRIEAHTESIYDVYMEMNNIDCSDREAFDTVIAKRNKIDAEAKVSGDIEERYAEQYQQLIQMIKDTLEEDGMDSEIFNDEYEDEY